jgi:hypothetical protein
MVTPNPEVLRVILSQKEWYLPRFVHLLANAEPLQDADAADIASAVPTHSPYRLSWIIHVLGCWADDRALNCLLHHFASPLPYAQDDATWAVSCLSPEVTVPRLTAFVYRCASTASPRMDATLTALARCAARMQDKARGDASMQALLDESLAAMELVLHRETTEPPERVLDVASYLASLGSASAWQRVIALYEQGYFEACEDPRDIYYLHELYDGRREHGLLAVSDRNWYLSGLTTAAR